MDLPESNHFWGPCPNVGAGAETHPVSLLPSDGDAGVYPAAAAAAHCAMF